jgi:hypothetical protein
VHDPQVSLQSYDEACAKKLDRLCPLCSFDGATWTCVLDSTPTATTTAAPATAPPTVAPTTTATTVPTTTTTTTAPTTAVPTTTAQVVSLATTFSANGLVNVLRDSRNGETLYFMRCSGVCLDHWPIVPPGLAGACTNNGAVTHPSGLAQLTCKGKPMFYSGDFPGVGSTGGDNLNGFKVMTA